MNAIKNVAVTPLSNELLQKFCFLYENKGKYSERLKDIKNEKNLLKRNIIAMDAEYICRIMDLQISDHKYKLITKKELTPRNKYEKALFKILSSEEIIHNTNSNFNLSTVGIMELQQFIFKELDEKVEFDTYKVNNAIRSKRFILDDLVDLFNTKIKRNDNENIIIICAFIVDFINIKPFKEYNDITAILLLQLLLKAYGFYYLDYVSFVEQIYQRRADFINTIHQASLSWSEGFPQFLHMVNFIIDILTACILELKQEIRNINFDANYNKIDIIETTIERFKGVFTKEQIREINPYISESTINRSLKMLRDSGKIRPIGKGRSAKWEKINKFKV